MLDWIEYKAELLEAIPEFAKLAPDSSRAT
jgi:hypothetical protein